MLQQGVDVGGATAGMVAAAQGPSPSEEVRQFTIERRRLDVRLATAPHGRAGRHRRDLDQLILPGHAPIQPAIGSVQWESP